MQGLVFLILVIFIAAIVGIGLATRSGLASPFPRSNVSVVIPWESKSDRTVLLVDSAQIFRRSFSRTGHSTSDLEPRSFVEFVGDPLTTVGRMSYTCHRDGSARSSGLPHKN